MQNPVWKGRFLTLFTPQMHDVIKFVFKNNVFTIFLPPPPVKCKCQLDQDTENLSA